MNEVKVERALVVGRDLFVDLWSLLGFEPIECPHPKAFGSIWNTLIEEDVSLVLLEERWFSQVPEIFKRRIEKMTRPSWVVLPSFSLPEEGGSFDG
ncbi:hypothetical protein [Thermovirga lienii]|jgi:vacuolar-type H+-ATPase subunit F/Vma7|uniref:hypothetical protein n=1 Tax=Thermovirga lienii TaxID=336261 RepID=UPI0002F3E456|nr:hypothetical protein [Thermovirga lienii]HCD71557.1 hypothetical protein [Thermovirga lienii]